MEKLLVGMLACVQSVRQCVLRAMYARKKSSNVQGFGGHCLALDKCFS